MNFAFDRVENILGKGENAGKWLPAFSPFPTMFSTGFFLRFDKTPDCDW